MRDGAPGGEGGVKPGSQAHAALWCRFFRRGWVTFDRSVNIKEICWNLQNIRVSAQCSSGQAGREGGLHGCWTDCLPLQLRECELSPGVNRDLTRRVRNINGITQHKQIVRNDIKLAAKLIHTLDDRTQLWAAEPGTTPLPAVSDTCGTVGCSDLSP